MTGVNANYARVASLGSHNNMGPSSVANHPNFPNSNPQVSKQKIVVGRHYHEGGQHNHHPRVSQNHLPYIKKN